MTAPLIVRIQKKQTAGYTYRSVRVPADWAEQLEEDGTNHVVVTPDGFGNIVLTPFGSDELREYRRQMRSNGDRVRRRQERGET